MTMTADTESLSQPIDNLKDSCVNEAEQLDDQSASQQTMSDGSVSTNRDTSTEPASPNEGLSAGEDDHGEQVSGSESESDVELDGEKEDGDNKEKDIPDGDSNADLHALLAFSKSRLEKVPQSPAPPVAAVEEEEPAEGTDVDDNDGESVDSEESYLEALNGIISSAAVSEDGAGHPDSSEEEALELAKANLMNAESKAAEDDPDREILEMANQKLQQAQEKANEEDPAYLLKLAEKKVREAEEKAKRDEEETGENVLKPALTTTKRSDANAELWALLNYSKKRLETGSTPQMGKRASSVKDDVSVTSKRSLSSKKSMSSKKSNTSGKNAPVSVVGSNNLGADFNGETESDVPFPDVTSGNVDDNGSVGSDMKNSIEDDDESQRSESDEDSSSEVEEEDAEDEEEDELPDFLKSDDSAEMDPDESKRLYAAARSYGASILSVSEDKLTDVQMLQAIAIAEEAAKKGETKFSTKSSLFKLHEAKLEDLKAFLDFGNSDKKSEAEGEGTQNQQKESEQVGWGIGKGRLVKKFGVVFQDFKQRCNEIDERKQQERQSQPSKKDILSAALLDLKKEIDNYETIKQIKNKN